MTSLDFLSLTHAELEHYVVATLREPRFRAADIFQWIHRRQVRSCLEMTSLSQDLRSRLAQDAHLRSLSLDAVATARDGTRKFRFVTHDGLAIESVLIPEKTKQTLCISSQVGCALDCRFCATAQLGLRRNLTSGEIIEQVYQVSAQLSNAQRVTHLVYMGMGEPLHNYREVVRSIRILTNPLGLPISRRRITVSTAGLVPGIQKLGEERLGINLAISLNATVDPLRTELMPINRKWNLERLLDAVRAYPLAPRQRVTFEYVLLHGVNDSDADAQRLARLLHGMRCKVNLIPWNPHPGALYVRPSAEQVVAFQQRVKALGLPAYLRTPRGDDIAAACGQLAAANVVPLRRTGST